MGALLPYSGRKDLFSCFHPSDVILENPCGHYADVAELVDALVSGSGLTRIRMCTGQGKFPGLSFTLINPLRYKTKHRV